MIRLGQIVEFDPDRGVGTVRSANDANQTAFHCTAIADGSRHIDPGAAVAYRLSPGHLGRWEATDIQAI